MGEHFIYARLSPRHKRLYALHQMLLFLTIFAMGAIAISVTNPVIVAVEDKLSVTIGAMVGGIVIILAFANRIKSIIKVKFVAFLITWVILLSLSHVMETLIYTVGLVLIPLAIDDLILLPIWRNVWYNQYYERKA